MATELNELRSFAMRYTAAWCSQEASQVAALYAPGASLSINGGVPAVGRSAITEVAQSFMTAFPDMQVFLDDISVEKTGTRYQWTLVGTNRGPGGTGHTVNIRGFEIWQIGADGLIACSEGHFDNKEFQRQLKHDSQDHPR